MTSEPRAPGPQADPPAGSADSLKQRIRDAEGELAATRGRVQHYQSLLQDLPEIFERKFRERLQPIAERNRLLAEEGAVLRDQIARTLPPAPLPQETQALPSATAPPAAAMVPAAAVPDPPPAAAGLAQSPSEPPPAAPAPGVVAAPSGRVAVAFAAAALLLGVVALVQVNRRPQPAAAPAAPARATTLQPRAGLLLLSTKGPSWIQVRTLDGQELFVGTLEGTRRFSIGRGLELRAGRPDLVLLRNGLQAPRTLGPIEAIQWYRVLPGS